MSRTKIPDSLIHKFEEVERNSQLFDKLCRVFQSVFQPIIEAKKKTELKQELQTDDECSSEFKEELEAYLCGAISFMVSYWINVLDGTCRSNQLSLTEHLLPKNHEYGQLFFHCLEDNHGIVEVEICRLMVELREKLFRGTPQVLLPLNLCIIKKSEGYYLENMVG